MSKTKEFIKKARAKHGDRYDYSKTKYTNSRSKVIIICPRHGEFEQIAGSHLKSHGCAICGAMLGNQSSTEKFIKKAIAQHGDRYDYSGVAYVNSRAKVKIVCRSHGAFLQTPFGHLQGRGCQECARPDNNKRRTTSEFIVLARAKHSNYYSYSRAKYLSGSYKITITCPKHGDFEQIARSHLNGGGCRLCINGISKTEAFAIKAKEKHGDTYSYCKVKYIKWDSPVVITCRDHGDFEQRPDHHLAGKGCAQCTATARLNTKEFIKKAIDKHGEIYDYSKTKYVNGRSPVVIICHEHGEFEQRATNHLMGNGCSLCPSNYRYDEPTSVYLMTNGKQVKIGYSIEPGARLTDLNKVQPFTAKLLLSWVLPDMPTARSAETDIHKSLADYHAGLAGFDGATEWFNTTPLHAAAVVANIVKQYQ